MDPFLLDQLDRRLLHALQIEPRAPWRELAPIVGADAATLARRWNRLEAEGLAWTTAYETQGQLALLEIECDLSHVNSVASAVSTDRAASVIDLASGSRDLLILSVTPSVEALSEYVTDRLGTLTGIRTVRTHLGNELLVGGANWRLRELTNSDAARIRPPRPPRPGAARTVSDELRESIEQATWLDGRASIKDIAQHSGFSPQRVSDALALLRSAGRLRFRTDIARAATDWPVYTWYFISAPAATVESLRHSIAAVPEVRLAFTAASTYNLILAVWLRDLAEVNRFEIALESTLKGARIADRAVVMRIIKHISRTIGRDSRATGIVSNRGMSPTVLPLTTKKGQS
ncbi:hypothetical protein MHM582_2589 [Microbacterium sp. HM58-2]|nr:hypothetical protein MHM582_2589 [Microbacterium sp. HM58-2]